MGRSKKKIPVPFYLAGVVLAGTYAVARFADGSDALVRVSAVLFLFWAAALVFRTVRSNRKDQ